MQTNQFIALSANMCITLLILFSACSGSKELPNQSNDGSTFETAIQVNSIQEEYQYIKKVCPDCELVEQSLMIHEEKPYDKLSLKTSDGTTKTFYFDISTFYGK